MVMVLSTGGPLAEAIEAAVRFAKEKKARLDVVFILESKVGTAIFDKLTDIGFIGEKPSEELEAAVDQEYRRQAEETLNEVRCAARLIGADATTEIVVGDFVEKSLEAVAKHAADVLIVARVRQSLLSKLMAGDSVTALLRQAPCEIKIFES